VSEKCPICGAEMTKVEWCWECHTAHSHRMFTMPEIEMARATRTAAIAEAVQLAVCKLAAQAICEGKDAVSVDLLRNLDTRALLREAT